MIPLIDSFTLGLCRPSSNADHACDTAMERLKCGSESYPCSTPPFELHVALLVVISILGLDIPLGLLSLT